MSPLTQEGRLLAITTPLGEGAMLLTGVSGREEMSRLFEYHLDLVSDEADISPKDIVGKNVTFSVARPDESLRYFNGFVSRFANLGSQRSEMTHYRAEIVPWLWFLTRTADCRIFQDMTVVEIIEKIFGDLGFSDFETGEIGGNHPKWEYCVQYRETDFNFVSRLMEHEGIFYFFRHENGKHTLVLADKKNAYKDCEEKEVAYVELRGDQLHEDQISDWEHQYEFRPGKWAQTDYNFKKPSTDLMTKEKSIVDLPGIDNFEIYDYPGTYAAKADGSGLTRVRMEEEEAAYDIVTAESSCRTFSPGGKFTIKDHPLEDGKTYVITSIRHTATNPVESRVGGTLGEDYANNFTCIPESVTYRPARMTPKPVVQGPQTAVVVGPAGEEIYPDEHGRVKVQFYWDREGKKDENSSCWIRVSQVHAGKSFGGIDIPRIGEEVVVGFLEGDPDQPLVIGRVYNAEAMPPYKLPDDMNVSGMKSNSTKGGGGYNEFILNDTKSKELIRLHAQYDMDSTIEHDDRQTVHNNRTITVDGTHTETIKGDTTIKISKGNLVHDVQTGTAKYHVQSDVDEDFDATQKTTVNKEIVITSETAHVHVIGSTEIKLNVGASTLLMKKDGSIKLDGANVAINGSESVTIHGKSVTSKADMDHNTKGNIVISEGAGTNTVKGGMVMLNP